MQHLARELLDALQDKNQRIRTLAEKVLDKVCPQRCTYLPDTPLVPHNCMCVCVQVAPLVGASTLDKMVYDLKPAAQNAIRPTIDRLTLTSSADTHSHTGVPPAAEGVEDRSVDMNMTMDGGGGGGGGGEELRDNLSQHSMPLDEGTSGKRKLCWSH